MLPNIVFFLEIIYIYIYREREREVLDFGKSDMMINILHYFIYFLNC